MAQRDRVATLTHDSGTHKREREGGREGEKETDIYRYIDSEIEKEREGNT